MLEYIWKLDVLHPEGYHGTVPQFIHKVCFHGFQETFSLPLEHSNLLWTNLSRKTIQRRPCVIS